MVSIRSTRMRTVTDARNGFSILVGEAQQGLTTHVIKGSQVVAHIVPANAPIIDDEHLLADLIAALAVSEAAAVTASGDWQEGVFVPAPQRICRLLAWAWRTDSDLYEKAFAELHGELHRQSGRAIAFSAVWEGIRPALVATGLEGGEITEMRIQLARLHES